MDQRLCKKLASISEDDEQKINRVVYQHYMQLKGYEIIYFEFKEIILEVCQFFKERLGSALKTKSLFKKFFDDYVFKNVDPLIKFGVQAKKSSGANEAKLNWPVSEKEKE